MQAPVVTREVALRIERAAAIASESRITHIWSLDGNPLGVELRRWDHVTAVLVQRDLWYYPYYNGPANVMAGDSGAMDEAVAWYRGRGLRCRVSACPNLVDEALLRHLVDVGLQPTGFMSLLYGVPEVDSTPPPPDVTVRESQDGDDFLAVWLEGAPAAERAALGPIVKAEFTEWRLYVAYLGAVLAAGGLPRLDILLWITLAMVGARTAAMSFNRAIDARLDAANPRPFNDYMDKVKKAVDTGAVACYIQGETADYYMGHNQPEVIAKVMDYVRQNGLLVGIGAHKIETIKACVDTGFQTDFWMKTMHHHNYWSANNPEWHDNKFDFSPEETIRYMNSLPQPVIGFKVMAAGAIHPRDGFRYAFENGADFVCAGMYDFQMVEDVNIACEILGSDLKRQIAWRG
jgi:hypothetical protein